MSDNTNFGFAKLVPGFDFLQNLTRGASQALPQMPNLSSWVAPTLNVEELEKRITELKAVHFWLEQNGKALGATIQALEVQKMTLATLQGMNFSMGEVANALKLQPTGGPDKGKPAEKAADRAAKPAAKGNARGNGAAPVDPLQWWGALTQQFQEIAAGAMKDVAQKTAAEGAKHMAAGARTETAKAAKKRAAPRKQAARRAAKS